MASWGVNAEICRPGRGGARAREGTGWRVYTRPHSRTPPVAAPTRASRRPGPAPAWRIGTLVLERALPSGVLRRADPRGRAVATATRRAALGSALLLLLLLPGCGTATPVNAPAAETCPITVAVATPTFSGHVLPMLRSTCGSGSATSCHGTPSPVGHVSYAPSLTAADVWGQLVGVDPSNAPTGVGWKRVAAGDVAHSWLIEKVTKDDPGGTGHAYGNRMPYGLPNLCAPTVQTLQAWIALGAAND